MANQKAVPARAAPFHKTDAESSDHLNIISSIHEFSRSFDEGDWTTLRRCLAATLATDCSSFRGTPPAQITADDFLALKQAGLAELTTQHLSFNHLVRFSDGQAQCRWEFAIHRWPRNPADRRFFHTFGSYTMLFLRADDAPHGWVISSITQHAYRNEGDAELHGATRAKDHPEQHC